MFKRKSNFSVEGLNKELDAIYKSIEQASTSSRFQAPVAGSLNNTLVNSLIINQIPKSSQPASPTVPSRMLSEVHFYDFPRTIRVILPGACFMESIIITVEHLFDSGTLSISDGTSLVDSSLVDLSVEQPYEIIKWKKYPANSPIMISLAGNPSVGNAAVILKLSSVIVTNINMTL